MKIRSLSLAAGVIGLVLVLGVVQPASAETRNLGAIDCAAGKVVESRAFVSAYHYQRHVSSTIRVKIWSSTSPSAYRFASFGYNSVSDVGLYSDANMLSESRYCAND